MIIFQIYTPHYCTLTLNKSTPLLYSCFVAPSLVNCDGLSPKPLWETLRMGGESLSKAKKLLIFHTKKVLLTKSQFLCNYPIQVSLIAVAIAIMLILINLCTECYYIQHEKALNVQHSSKKISISSKFQCYLENQLILAYIFPLPSSFQTL